MMALLDRIIRTLDAVSIWTGRVSCWLVIPLMMVLAYEVFVRKLFISPTTWALDLSYMLTGTYGMVGAAYALYRGAHISTDLISQRWPPRVQAALNVLFYAICFFPGLGVFLWFASGFAYRSWVEGERAITSAWMPPLYPLKIVMAVGTALLLVQGVSDCLKNLRLALWGRRGDT